MTAKHSYDNATSRDFGSPGISIASPPHSTVEKSSAGVENVPDDRPSAPYPSDQPFCLASKPLGEASPCRIISIRLPQRKTPHQHLRLLFISRPSGRHGHGVDRGSERRRQRARTRSAKKQSTLFASTPIAIFAKMSPSRSVRGARPVQFGAPPTPKAASRQAPARSDVRSAARHRTGRSEGRRGRTHHFREHGRSRANGTGLPGIRRPRA